MATKRKKKFSASEKRDLKQFAKHLGVPELMGFTKADLRTALKKMAKGLPKEKRQAILDDLNAQQKTEDIAAAHGVSSNEVRGVFFLNIRTCKYLAEETA